MRCAILSVLSKRTLAIPNYLAEHYFFKREFELCGELCEAGLQILKNKTKPEMSDLPTYRHEIEMLRSTFHFILGKVEHA